MLRRSFITLLPAAVFAQQKQARIFSMAFAPDGSVLALGGFREVWLADPATGKTVATLSGHVEIRIDFRDRIEAVL